MDKYSAEVMNRMVEFYPFLCVNRGSDPAPCEGASLDSLEFSVRVYVVHFLQELGSFDDLEIVIARLPVSSLVDRLSVVLVNKAETPVQLAKALLNPKVRIETLGMEKEKVLQNVREVFAGRPYPQIITDESMLTIFLVDGERIKAAVKFVEECLGLPSHDDHKDDGGNPILDLLRSE